MKPIILFFIFIFLLISLHCIPQRVVHIYDGDTFLLSTGERIRLQGVDAPELSQEYGGDAKNFTQTWLLNKEVVVVMLNKTRDVYNREVAIVFIKGLNFNTLLVMNGWAWVYKKFDKDGLYPLMQEARKQRRGIWKSYATPPFIYRHQTHIK